MIKKASQLILTTLCFSLLSAASGQGSLTAALITELRNGGYIIFMRHANAPGELPTAATAAPGNSNLERQLDETGRRDAIAFGDAIRRLGIPISSVERSPTFRTRQTVDLAGFTEFTVQDFLLEERMVGVTPERLSRLKEELQKKPATGNRLFVSHSGNIMASFPELDPYINQGEAIIVRATERGSESERESELGYEMLARVLITEWPNF